SRGQSRNPDFRVGVGGYAGRTGRLAAGASAADCGAVAPGAAGRSRRQIPPVEAAARLMAYQVEIGPQAQAQFGRLDSVIGVSIERKIVWLATNAPSLMHRRLVGMPKDLEGLCKLRIGDYRVLYWVYHEKKLVRLYRILHRSEVYRDF